PPFLRSQDEIGAQRVALNGSGLNPEMLVALHRKRLVSTLVDMAQSRIAPVFLPATHTGSLGPGRPGWLPTQVPHRSGLAHHAHPVPHLMNSRPARSVVGTWTWFRSRCTC